jgi:hypothetical protein
MMLWLFALSVTPKQLLHDVITGHKHSLVKDDAVVSFQTSKKNIQCNWHNDAVESPFTDQPAFEVDHPFPPYASYIILNIGNRYSAEHFFSALRGPPSLA